MQNKQLFFCNMSKSICFSQVDNSILSLAHVALGCPFVSCPSYGNSYEPSEWLIKPIPRAL